MPEASELLSLGGFYAEGLRLMILAQYSLSQAVRLNIKIMAERQFAVLISNHAVRIEMPTSIRSSLLSPKPSFSIKKSIWWESQCICSRYSAFVLPAFCCEACGPLCLLRTNLQALVVSRKRRHFGSTMSIFRALIRTTIICITFQCAIATLDPTTRQDCSCGFYDPETSERFTDSIVVYFNETESLPDDFAVQHYENHYEKGWNTQYRQGAIAGNVGVGKNSMYADNGTKQSLELYCDSTTPTHLVNGGGIQTSYVHTLFH